MRAGLLLLLTFPAGAAEWVRVAAPRIEVFTDAGERTGRRVLGRFEEVHRIFHQANIADTTLALRVFVFASAGEFHNYHEEADGFYRNGMERDYIALHDGPEVARAAT